MLKVMRALTWHHRLLTKLAVQLLLMTCRADCASKPCVSTPCFFPTKDFESIKHDWRTDENMYNWDSPSQMDTNDHPLGKGEWNLHYFPIGATNEDEILGKAYEDTEKTPDVQYGGRHDDYPYSQPIVLFLTRSPPQVPSYSRCYNGRNKGICNFINYNEESLKVDGMPEKRGRIQTQKWSAAGLPFSVLYHKQVRAKSSSNGGQGSRPAHSQPAPQRAPDAWAPQVGPVVTTRKQYSTLPHLFVSYGWGPLGK